MGTECMARCVCLVEKMIISLRMCFSHFRCPRGLFLRCNIVFLLCFSSIYYHCLTCLLKYIHARHVFCTSRMPHAWLHHRHQQQHRQVIIYNSLHSLHCITLLHYCIALHYIAAVRGIALIALHCITTCLESLVGYSEISQWP